MRALKRPRRPELGGRLKVWFAKIGTLNIILLIVCAFFIWFNAEMLQIYREVGSIPEQYACAVIAATIGECGFCGWIRTTKDKQRAKHETREESDNAPE